MIRVKSSITKHRRHKRIMGLKGYTNNQYKMRLNTFENALLKQFISRKNKKRELHNQAIQALNSFSKLKGLSYARIINCAPFQFFSREILADLIRHETPAYTALYYTYITRNYPQK